MRHCSVKTQLPSTIVMRAAKNKISVRCRFGNRDKLRHRAERLVQAVELVAQPAGARSQPGEAVERAVDASIIGEVEKRRAVRDQEIDPMLVGMDPRNIAASVNVRQVLKCLVPAAIAEWRGVCDCAFIDVCRSGIDIGCSSVGNRCERQIVPPCAVPQPPKKSAQFV